MTTPNAYPPPPGRPPVPAPGTVPPGAPPLYMPAPQAAMVKAPKPPRRFFVTLLELSAIGTVGWLAFGAITLLASLGFGLLIVFGVGLLFLIALVYVLYGTAAFEVYRVDGLYQLGVDPVPFSRPRAPGFKGYFLSLWNQLKTGRMWVALGSYAVSLLIGSSIVSLLGLAASRATRANSQIILLAKTPVSEHGSLYWLNQDSLSGAGGLSLVFPDNAWMSMNGPFWGIVTALSAIALIMLLVYVGRAANIAIIGSSARTKQLSTQAFVAQQQARATSMQREGAVRAADLERTRIERDLHDGVQPRLVSVAMTLGLAQQQIDKDPDKAKELVAEAHTSTKAAITELRQLARGIHASVLDDRGLDAALSALAGRSPVPTQLDVRLIGPNSVPVTRVSREAETAVYFSIAESLTNAAKHSRAGEARVIVRLRPNPNAGPGSPFPGILWARVEDNGLGGARVVEGGGLDGIINRVRAAGGTARLDSPDGGPTSLEVSVPCAF